MRSIRSAIVTSEFNPSSISSAKAALKDLVDNQSGADKVKKGQIRNGTDNQDTPFPLEFAATIDGNDGFTFGHTLKSDYLPARYKKGNGICFTVTDLEHTIAGSDWTTTLNAIMRLRGSAGAAKDK